HGFFVGPFQFRTQREAAVLVVPEAVAQIQNGCRAVTAFQCLVVAAFDLGIAQLVGGKNAQIAVTINIVSTVQAVSITRFTCAGQGGVRADSPVVGQVGLQTNGRHACLGGQKEVA